MTHLNKQEFWEWAYDDLLANTTRGVLAEYIVARALGIVDKRVEWHRHDLDVDGFGVEVKSAAYVQSWKQTRDSVIGFGIGPTMGWDAGTDTYPAIAERSADVYIFCLLKGKLGDHINPLDAAQWTFYVLPTSVLNDKVPVQKRIGLARLKALEPKECAYEGLKAAIHEAAAANRGA
ncbi:hypothetical protein [Mycobacterium sp. Z3061]|uniref:hypothetical protein n=1 Tax=Mycobacterium sp. Z3061 TaxID=3073562 RepID=UPI002873C9A2|nr:hypothetical protein [Mycobacterium sp. Z3061]